MNIDNLLFISAFLPVALVLYWLIPGQKGKNILLLAASLVFYAFGSVSGLILLLIAVLFNYVCGLLIIGRKTEKIVCIVAIVCNLAFLGAFKYLNFFVTEILGLQPVELGVAAPLGISFFVFKCISYIVDSYRNPEHGSKNIEEVLLYISFFPQVVAGPITRFSQFKGQLKARTFCIESISSGLRRFVIGLFKKVVLAGILGQVADKVFAMESGVLDICLAWLGAIAYMLQIYFDFSGYSDMAIGLGKCFGIDTPENFQYPYGAVSVTDFWRRWHISLSSWFRDYLYIPLGGNRKGKYRAALNKCIVFTLCGIWHGAAWTFVVWGLWHGLFSALESMKAIRIEKGRVLSRIYTLLVVCLGFVMFRAESLPQGVEMIKAMFNGFAVTGATLRGILTGEAIVALIAGVLMALPIVPWLKKTKWGQWLEPASYALCIALFVVCLMKTASGGFTPFIYAQF